MEREDQTPPLQVPDETNDYKHIDFSSSKDAGSVYPNHKIETKGGQRKDKDGEGSSDFASDIMQTETDIDPGNEHHH